jgi:carotenoid cleavage dioxygenase-like enzyme
MPTTAMTSPTPTRLPSDLRLEIEGAVPAGLDGYFLQACAHPSGAAGRRPMISGVRLTGGRAELADTEANPFGPLTAGLLPPESRAAHPVREVSAPLWHTVAIHPGSEQADHLTMAEDGTVLRVETFPLPGAPLVQLAITERYLVVVDLPVVHNRAAALLGSPVRHAWQPNRPTRIGLLPLRPDGSEPRWFPIGACRISRIVNAYDEGNRVVLDAVRDGHVCRWELDLPAGRVRTRRLTEAVELTTVDGRRHRNIFATNTSELGEVSITRYDLTTWRTEERRLGTGVRASQPVHVGGWLLVLVEDPVHRRSALLVLDAGDLTAKPAAVVHIPLVMPASPHASWMSTWQDGHS